MGDLKNLVESTLSSFLEKNELEIYDIEYKKEGKDNVLRVYVDRIEGYIDTDTCEKVSMYLSEKLDELDPIDSEYVLEVSSPGMDRELKLDKHFSKYIGEVVDVTLKNPINDGPLKGKNKIEGTLKEFTSDYVKVVTYVDLKEKNRKPGAKIGKDSISEIEVCFKRDEAKVNLAVIF